MSVSPLTALIGLILAAEPAPPEWSVRGRSEGALAEDAWRALLTDPAPPRVARRLVREGKTRLVRALLERLERAATERSDPFASAMALGHLRLASDDAEGALGAFEMARRARPQAPATLLWRARCLERLGRGDEALADYRALAALPGSPAQRRTRQDELATWARKAHRPEVELEALRALVSLGPLPARDRTEVLRRLGEAALDVGAATATLGWLEGRLGACSGRGCAPEWTAIARLRQSLGEHEAARAAWEQVLRVDRGSRVARDGLARLETAAGSSDRQEAQNTKRRRGGPDPLVELAELESRLPLPPGTRWQPVFDRALRVARFTPGLLERLADLASRLGDPDRVTACFELLLEAEPRNRRAIIGLGEAHFQAGRREMARRVWGRLLGAVRPRTAALGELAEILADHGFLDEAEAHARAALEQAPRSAANHRILARILEARRELGAAASAWRAVLEHSPEAGGAALRREARTRLTELFAREGRERLQAETVTLRARLRQHPDDRDAALFLTEMELLLGRPNRAVEALSLAAAEGQADEELLGRLIALLRQSKQHGAALEWLEKLAAAAPGRAAGAYLTMAEIRADAYQDELAAAATARAMEAAPRAADVLLPAGQLLERLGRTNEAEAAYRAAERAGGDVPGITAQARAALTSLRLRLAEPMTGAEQNQPAPATAPLPSLAEVWVLAGRTREDPAAVARLKTLGRRHARGILGALTEPHRAPPLEAMVLAGVFGLEDTVPALRSWLTGRPLPAEKAEDRETAARVAAMALGRIGDARAGADLTALALGRGGEPLRATATWALGRVRDVGSEDALAGLTRDADASIAALAILGLARLGGPAAMARVRAAALDPVAPSDVRRAALLGLALGDSPAPLGPALIPLLAAPRLRDAAAIALAAHPEPEVEQLLVEQLLVGNVAQRLGATGALAWQLEGLGPLEESTALVGDRVDTPALLDALTGPPRASSTPASTSTSTSASAASNEAGPTRVSATPPGGAAGDGSAPTVVAMLLARRPQVMAAALESALFRPGPVVGRALELLARVEGAPCPVRDGGAGSLAKVCSVLESAFAALLARPDPATGAATLLAADRLGVPVSAVPTLLALLPALAAGADPGLQDVLLVAVGRVAPRALTDPRAAAALAPRARALLASPSPPVRRLGVSLLGAAGQLDAAAVKTALSDPDPRVRVEAVGWLHDRDALARTARDPNPAVRLATARAREALPARATSRPGSAPRPTDETPALSPGD